MDFDPNFKHKPKTPPYATYIPDRRPEFKLHANVGHAKNAFQYRSNAILYKWDTDIDEWIELARIEGFRHRDVPCPIGCGGKSYSAGWEGMRYVLKPCYKCQTVESRLKTAPRELGI